MLILLDLNLEMIVTKENPHICSSFKNTNNLNSSEVYVPSKQTRITRFGSSSPLCQVHGCNKNLVSCKDYHKRHKVCELHSKTAKVIVNGIVQRFCQQCSRFHLLNEFDDGKRSCRKRLADHNERRRKPHGGAGDYITMDPATPARSLLSSQLQGDSSSHSSRNLVIIPSTHNAHQASRGSNNMNVLECSEYVNPETLVWSNDGSTIDFLQLSSELELERVEHQKEVLHTVYA